MDSTWGLVKKQSRMAGAPKDSTFVRFLSVASITGPSNVLNGNRRLQRLDYLQKLMMSRKRRALRRAVSNHRRVTSMQVTLHLLMGMKKQARRHPKGCEKFSPGTSIPMHVEDTSLLFIEACAGSALLSSVMRGAGFDVLAIDFGKVSRNSNIHVINLDFATDTLLEIFAYSYIVEKSFSLSWSATLRHSVASAGQSIIGTSSWTTTAQIFKVSTGISLVAKSRQAKSFECKSDIHSDGIVLHVALSNSCGLEH